MEEFVNGHQGSRDLGIYQNTIPNMERGTKESGVRSEEYKKSYLRSPPLDHRRLGHQRVIQAGIFDWSIVRKSASVIVTAKHYWLISFSCNVLLHKLIN